MKTVVFEIGVHFVDLEFSKAEMVIISGNREGDERGDAFLAGEVWGFDV
jgi:hypothetical protein